MPRLPLPGGDDGDWGDILNEYLEVEHDADGNLKTSSGSSLGDHILNTSNPHAVTKTQVGLANVPNTDATQRANHTGTQAISTVTDLQDELDGKAETSHSHTETIGIVFVISGGGEVIESGQLADIEVPFACTVVGHTTIAAESGTCVVDIRRSTYSGYPTVSSIAGSEKPGTSGSTKGQDLSLSSWTTSIAAGDILRAYVESNDNATQITVTVRATKAV